MLKEFTVKYMRVIIVVHKYSLHFETERPGFVPYKKVLSMKLQ